MRLRRALDALQWGEGRHLADLEFLVIDRAAPGGQRSLSGKELRGRDASYLIMADGTQLPFHRVAEVRLEGRTVWKKRTRGPKAAGEGEEAAGEEGGGLLTGMAEAERDGARIGGRRPRRRKAAAAAGDPDGDAGGKPAERPEEKPAEGAPEEPAEEPAEKPAKKPADGPAG